MTTTGDPVLRAATLDDLDAIMALERLCFPHDAWSPRMMRDELASPHGRYVVLEHDGLVGYAGLRAVAGSRDGDVQTIAVAEASRGHGWGRMLLTALIAEAARRGVRDLFLEVRADNPVAQALYASEGFRAIGRRPHYYRDVDAIVMQADLRARGAAPGSEDRVDLGRSGPNPPSSTRSSEVREGLDAAVREGLDAAAREGLDAAAGEGLDAAAPGRTAPAGTEQAHA